MKRQQAASSRMAAVPYGALVGMLLLLAGLGAARGAGATEPDWPRGPYKYLVIKQRVEDALSEFGRNTGIPIRISDQVEGRLSGGMEIGTAKEFLQRICESYGLVWYFDGSILHVNAESEVRTQLVELGPVAPDRLVDRLYDLGVADERYALRVAEGGGVVSVSGPPPYISFVRETLTKMRRSMSPRIAREVTGRDAVSVRVFRGRGDGS